VKTRRRSTAPIGLCDTVLPPAKIRHVGVRLLVLTLEMNNSIPLLQPKPVFTMGRLDHFLCICQVQGLKQRIQFPIIYLRLRLFGVRLLLDRWYRKRHIIRSQLFPQFIFSLFFLPILIPTSRKATRAAMSRLIIKNLPPYLTPEAYGSISRARLQKIPRRLPHTRKSLPSPTPKSLTSRMGPHEGLALWASNREGGRGSETVVRWKFYRLHADRRRGR